MFTYVAAQYALAGGVLRAAATAPRSAPDLPRAPRTAGVP